jgi:hypothetical protein
VGVEFKHFHSCAFIPKFGGGKTAFPAPKNQYVLEVRESQGAAGAGQFDVEAALGRHMVRRLTDKLAPTTPTGILLMCASTSLIDMRQGGKHIL